MRFLPLRSGVSETRRRGGGSGGLGIVAVAIFCAMFSYVLRTENMCLDNDNNDHVVKPLGSVREAVLDIPFKRATCK